MDFRQACDDSQALGKAARRFAAYRVYCKERKHCPHVASHRNVSGFRLACTPATGDLITLAMHDALCEHQHPLPFEFERAAALYEVAYWIGYLGSCADSKLDPEEFARFILA